MSEEQSITKLERLYSEAIEDFKLDQMNLREKALTCATIKSKWCYKAVQEDRLLQKMEAALKNTINQFAVDNAGKYKGDDKARLAAESDPEIKKIKKAIEHQKDCNRFIQLVLEKNIGSFGFDIKNAVDMIKIEGM